MEVNALHIFFSSAEHVHASSIPPHDPFKGRFIIRVPRLSSKKHAIIINKVNNNCIFNFKLKDTYFQGFND